MTTSNPYAAPKAAVADETVVLDADFVPGGQSRPIGHGWRWIAEGWALFKRQPGLWIGMVLLLFLIMMGTALIPFIGGLFMTLFGPVFAAGIVIGCRALERGEELEIGHLFAGFRERTGTLVAVGAIYLAASLVVMLVVGLSMGVGMSAMMGQAAPEDVATMGLTMVLAMLVVFAPAPAGDHGDLVRRSAGRVPRARRLGRDEGQLRRLPEEHPAVPLVQRGVHAARGGGLPAADAGLACARARCSPLRSIPAYRDIYLKPR